ncbi:COBRA-like protein 1 [Fagus crenata]
MALTPSLVWSFALVSIVLVAICSLSDCYDPLDPNGNITVTFDIHKWTTDGYLARVTIQNFYQYRHVDKPGWSIGWSWTNNEVIWSMSGAFATQQGNCETFKSTPHCCKRDPVRGLLPWWSSFCLAIDPSNSFSSFEIKVGNLVGNFSAYEPQNLTLIAPGPGYTCGPILDTDPTVSLDVGGRRQIQVLKTWKSTCTYSSFLANKKPVCCVSLSTFYNPNITPCPKCSCGCRDADKTTASCLREVYPSSISDFSNNLDEVQCTDHMCPVRVHWHVKSNYMSYWRVKLTISNYDYQSNFSNWNMVVQHSGFSQPATTYSFNSTVLPTVGFGDEVALFWGIEYFNTILLHADEDQVGSLSSEILFNKDTDSFTLSNGWAFPRRIYFNGENCEMPLPDTFPMLPNGSSSLKPSYCKILLLLFFTFITLVTWL